MAKQTGGISAIPRYKRAKKYVVPRTEFGFGILTLELQRADWFTL